MQYPSHGLTGGLQLYDFARDPEVKLLAKAHFDWVCAATTVEYFRGSWAGSNIRDYGNIGPHSGAAGEFWHHFGDLAQPAKNPYRDLLRLITSAYRPPAAVVELARKDFPKPVEILASKPSYEDWFKGGEKAPTSRSPSSGITLSSALCPSPSSSRPTARVSVFNWRRRGWRCTSSAPQTSPSPLGD
jgi:hypothetical protein